MVKRGKRNRLNPMLFAQHIGKWLRRRVALSQVLLWICFFVPLAGNAAAIEIVLSSEGDEYHQVANQIRAGLRDSRHYHESLEIKLAQSLDADSGNLPLQDSKLVVAVGVRALKKVLDGPVDFPVYAVLVPCASYDKLLDDLDSSGRGALKHYLSALYLDQPPKRQLELVKALGGDRFRVVGLLLAEKLDVDIKPLVAQAKRLDIELRDIRVAGSRDIVPTLKRAQRKIDMLLTMFDPSLINTQTIKQILYFSYHRRLPVLGYSQAMVKAGALAAIYSTAEQVGRHAAEEIVAALDHEPLRLPPRSFPKYYQVTCNSAVADYFNLQADCALQSLSHPGPESRSGAQ